MTDAQRELATFLNTMNRRKTVPAKLVMFALLRLARQLLEQHDDASQAMLRELAVAFMEGQPADDRPGSSLLLM